MNAVTWELELVAGIDRARPETVAVIETLVDAAERSWAEWLSDHPDDAAEKWGAVESVLLAAVNVAAPLRRPALRPATDPYAQANLVDFTDPEVWHHAE